MSKMRRVSQWAVVATLAVALVGLPVQPTMAGQLSKAQVLAQIQKAKQDKLNAQAKVSQLQQHIGQLHSQAADLNSQLLDVMAQITTTQTQIDQTVFQIQKRDQQIVQTRSQIAATQVKLNLQSQVLSNHLRVMYEVGHTSYLAVLFSATSFSDLLSRFQLLTLVAQQDKLVFNAFQAQAKQLQTRQTQLSAMLTHQRSAYAILLQSKATQTNQQQTERRLRVHVQDQAVIESADLNSETNALASIGSQLKALQNALGSFHSTQPAGPWDWPVPGYTSISSGYGWRTLFGRPDFHPGIDIPAPVGTPIVAATPGRVLFAGPAQGYGDWIVIESGNGLMEIYGHMYPNELEVSPGEIVKEGQEIARVGSNGMSTGPHLHFEVATGIGSDGVPISTDPTKYVGG